MARKYYYNQQTCQFEVLKISKKKKIFQILCLCFCTFILAIGLVNIYTTYFESNKEQKLKKKNIVLHNYYLQLQKEINRIHKILSQLQSRDDNLYRILFQASPISSSIRQAGVGGTDRYKKFSDKDTLIINTYKKINQLKKQLFIQEKSFDELLSLAKKKAKKLASIPAIQPIANKQLTRLVSGYGMRFHPILKVLRLHGGIDFVAPKNTPVYATGNGVIRLVNTSSSYGNQVEIDHGYGYVTKYAHLQSWTVKKGQKIKRGECIGKVGSTGLSQGPHLHYEVIKNGKKINPMPYFILNELTAEEYEQLIALASRQNQSLD